MVPRAAAVPLDGTQPDPADQAPPRVRSFAKPTLELLAGIPTVVYGFFAITVITPALLPLFNLLDIPLGNPNNQIAGGIVVGIEPVDYRQDGERSGVRSGEVSPLDGIAFQRHWESRAFDLGGGTYDAPAQRVGDFLAGIASTAAGTVAPSYTPGVKWTDLSSALPAYAIEAIRESLPAFERRIKGFAMADAVLTGVETRTSSPLRIPRGRDFQSLNVRGLYPAGEGAGYAGGIMSAGVDGIEVAEAVGRAMPGLEQLA